MDKYHQVILQFVRVKTLKIAFIKMIIMLRFYSNDFDTSTVTSKLAYGIEIEYCLSLQCICITP